MNWMKIFQSEEAMNMEERLMAYYTKYQELKKTGSNDEEQTDGEQTKDHMSEAE